MSTIMYEKHLFEEIGTNEDYPLQGMAPYNVKVKAAGPRAASFVLEPTPVTIIDPATPDPSLATSIVTQPPVHQFPGCRSSQGEGVLEFFRASAPSPALLPSKGSI